MVRGVLSGLRRFLANESPSKMMKNALYFTGKTLFVHEIFNFLFWLFGHDKTAKVKFKTYDVTNREIIFTKYILPDISRIKGNRTIRFDELVEHNMRKTFLEKSCTK